MPISLDNSSNSGGTLTNVSTFSWNHSVGSSLQNSILIIGFQLRDTNLVGNSAITAQTYNSIATTPIVTDVNSADGLRTALYYILNPTSGSNLISVTLTGSCVFVSGGAVSLSGVNQSNPIDVSNGGHGQAVSSQSVSLTTTENNDWIIDSLYQKSGNVSSLGGSMNNLFELYPGSSPANTANGTGDTTDMSYQIAGVKGSYSNSYSWSPADDVSMVAVAIRPFIPFIPQQIQQPYLEKTEVVDY